MKLQITGFFPNNWHEDCMGGLKYLKSQKIRSYANQLTIKIAKKKGLSGPDQEFKDSLRPRLVQNKNSQWEVAAVRLMMPIKPVLMP